MTLLHVMFLFNPQTWVVSLSCLFSSRFIPYSLSGLSAFWSALTVGLTFSSTGCLIDLMQPPFEMFADVHSFAVARLPQFYVSLFTAWSALRGSSVSSDHVVGSGLVGGPTLAVSLTCKLAYQLLLSFNLVQPHYILKFASSSGALDWPVAWKSLQFMPLDRHVRDLSWKVAHGILYTADRLISFGYQIALSCFCGYQLECVQHLFFSCPLAKSGLN